MPKHYDQADAPPAPELKASPEQALWLAVIERALEDTRSGDAARCHAARRWLLASPEFLLVADYAGVENPPVLRTILARYLTAPPAGRVRGQALRPRAGTIDVAGIGLPLQALIARAGIRQKDLAGAVRVAKGGVSALVCGLRTRMDRALLVDMIAYFRARGLEAGALERFLWRRPTLLTAPIELPRAA